MCRRERNSEEVVGAGGFEPPTCCSQSNCATTALRPGAPDSRPAARGCPLADAPPVRRARREPDRSSSSTASAARPKTGPRSRRRCPKSLVAARARLPRLRQGRPPARQLRPRLARTLGPRRAGRPRRGDGGRRGALARRPRRGRARAARAEAGPGPRARLAARRGAVRLHRHAEVEGDVARRARRLGARDVAEERPRLRLRRRRAPERRGSWRAGWPPGPGRARPPRSGRSSARSTGSSRPRRFRSGSRGRRCRSSS